MLNIHKSLFTSNSADWLTPPAIVALVVRVLGAIDLDPCSDTDHNIPATAHYTIADNGLMHPWRGRVFLNPVYGPTIGTWISKLLLHYNLGDVSQAIVLVPARTDTKWFGLLQGYACCFVRGRLRFSGHDNSAPFPSAIFYLDNDLGHFAGVFGRIGDVRVPYGDVGETARCGGWACHHHHEPGDACRECDCPPTARHGEVERFIERIHTND
jgi:hypothetical protein